VTAGVGAGLALAYVELGLVAVVAYVVGTRVLRLTRPCTGALVVVSILANTGYLGLPLIAATLGAQGLAAGIAWDSLVSGPMFYVVAMAIGASLGTRAGQSARERLSTFVLRNPPLLAAVAGLLAPSWMAPQALVDIAHVVVYALLPTGFFILGINMAAEAEEGTLRLPLTRATATAVGLRLLLAPALLAALSALTIGVPKAYFVQAAMPGGINSLVVAHAYGLDLRLTTSAIAWTTGIALTVAVVFAVTPL
jgi:predicted permease